MTRASDLSPIEKMILARVAVAPWPLRPDDKSAKKFGLAAYDLSKQGLVLIQPGDGVAIIEITEKGARLAAKIGKK